jgi:hypothetical protein
LIEALDEVRCRLNPSLCCCSTSTTYVSPTVGPVIDCRRGMADKESVSRGGSTGVFGMCSVLAVLSLAVGCSGNGQGGAGGSLGGSTSGNGGVAGDGQAGAAGQGGAGGQAPTTCPLYTIDDLIGKTATVFNNGASGLTGTCVNQVPAIGSTFVVSSTDTIAGQNPPNALGNCVVGVNHSLTGVIVQDCGPIVVEGAVTLPP